MSKLSPVIVVIMSIACLSGMSNTSNLIVQAQDAHVEHSAMEALPIINQDSVTQLDTNDKISFKIKGIDYSTIIAQILITIDGKTYAQTFDPISLLDPHDDGNGVIQFDMLIPKEVMKLGSTYTSCIGSICTDNYGTSSGLPKGFNR